MSVGERRLIVVAGCVAILVFAGSFFAVRAGGDDAGENASAQAPTLEADAATVAVSQPPGAASPPKLKPRPEPQQPATTAEPAPASAPTVEAPTAPVQPTQPTQPQSQSPVITGGD